MVQIEQQTVPGRSRSTRRLWLPATALTAFGMLGLAMWASTARSETESRSESKTRFESETRSGSESGPAVGNEEVSELVANLDDPRSAIRREAMVRLARIGTSASEAIPGVTSRLHDEDPFVRAHAARAACRIGADPNVAVPVLADLLQPEDQKLCCLASLVLGEIGSGARPALPVLRTCMKSRAPAIRLHAAEAILKIDSTDWSALRELMAGTESDLADLRYFAANALGEAALDNDQAIFALQRALTDEDTNVAITAALNLSKRFHLPRGTSGNVPESEELGRLIENLRDPVPAARQTAAIRLGMAGTAARRAGIALVDKLNDPDMAVRLHVAHALWQIERPAGAVVPVLIDLLGVSKSNVRNAAAYVLGEIGPAASDALPALYDVFAGSRLRDRLLLSMVISLIEPRDREMVGIIIVGLHEQAGDVRYQSAIALGSAPIAHQRRVERALAVAAGDRNLRVQSAASEALSRFELRIHEARNALSAQYASNFGTVEADPATTSIVDDTPPSPPDENDATEPIRDGQYDQGERDSRPPARAIARSMVPIPLPEDYSDPNEGLKHISAVHASIRVSTGDEPPDYASPHFVKLAQIFHPLGTTRGWRPISYGWDAPAMYYQPVYFEDIKQERYGIHNGLCSPFVSFGTFYWNMLFLPYKLVAQPMCECHYNLGYERPNNCVPVYCYGWGSLDRPLLWWCSRHNYCPIRPACPWTRDCRPCNTECGAFYEPDRDPDRADDPVRDYQMETSMDGGPVDE